MFEPFHYAFVQRGALELLLLSLGAGVLGTWIVLRGLAFFSHGVATAAFPGLVLAAGLGFPAPLGAFGAALVFALGVERLAHRRRQGHDTLTALVLVGALALGVILASNVFHSRSNVETLLFGSVLAVGDWDLAFAGAVSALVVLVAVVFAARWLAVGFDAASARALGVRGALTDALLLLAGCGGTTSRHGPLVIATTTQIGDWARAVGGAEITVHQLLQPNTDPHEYEPRPADVIATAGAAVVFENGDGLDHWMAK